MLQPTLNTICNTANAGQTLLVISAEDLRQFAMDIAREVMQQNEPQYFTRKELMDYLGVCSRTLWGYENEGIITAVKIGRQNRYNKAEIFEAVDEGKLKPLKNKKK
ncbi:MAG: helix-turn-helix domain-containing protein [Prevotella sp.]|jgi:hypothetical protein|nr:helix-turn-helix domain-containing protein [Prevotella sp.]MBR1557605.1 helix-turn-helix domain-containing protein [Prevotella sp.]